MDLPRQDPKRHGSPSTEHSLDTLTTGQPSPGERSSHTDQAILQKFLGYRVGIQGIHAQLRTRNDLRKVAESELIEEFITKFTTILSEVEDQQELSACFPQGTGAFCKSIEDAIFQLYAAKKAVEVCEENFDVQVDVQPYNALRKCRGCLELVLEEIQLVLEPLQKSA